MATVTRQQIGTLHDKITVKLSKEDYLPSFEKSLKQYAKQANVPGFRKGMVPAGMVKKMYGESLFGDEILKSAGRQLEEYLQNEKLAIFAQPMVLPNEQPLNLDMNNPSEVDFAFEVGLKPDFEVTALKNKATLTRYKVTAGDKMLQDELERIRRRYGKVESQDTVSSPEDLIYATFEQTDAQGDIAEGTEKVESTILLDKLPAKLKEQLMTKGTGEMISFRPSEVAEGEELTKFLQEPLKQGPEAAGENFRLTITKVGHLIPRELDTELFLQVFPNEMITTEDAFRERIRLELAKEYDRLSAERLHNEIFELLVHTTPLQLPVDFLKRWLKEGQEKPKSASEVEKEFPSFDHQLRWQLISDKLIQDSGINVTHSEVKEDIKGRVLAYFGMEADEDAPWMDSYMQKMEKDNKTMDETYRRILFDRLFQWLETQFSIEEKEVTEEEFFKLPDAHAAHHHHH
jgi:trigger factor